MNNRKTTFPFSLLTVLLVTMGSVISDKFGMLCAFIMALSTNLFSSWLPDGNQARSINVPC